MILGGPVGEGGQTLHVVKAADKNDVRARTMLGLWPDCSGSARSSPDYSGSTAARRIQLIDLALHAPRAAAYVFSGRFERQEVRHADQPEHLPLERNDAAPVLVVNQLRRDQAQVRPLVTSSQPPAARTFLTQSLSGP